MCALMQSTYLRSTRLAKKWKECVVKSEDRDRNISPFAQSISTILNFKQRMDSFFRDKSKICVLERANEAILIHKLGSKYTRFVNTMKVGMFWTKHSLQPHEISISITNVYSIG